MTSGVRRFFWGNSLAQALTAAARHYGLSPEELDYRIYAKRHGFVKHPRKVVIEIDPAAPRRAPGSTPASAPAPATKAPAPVAREERSRPERAPRFRRDEASEPAEGEVVRRGLALLEQMELLIPRAGQGLSGRRVRCRVDCGGLHRRREEELRAFALREAEAVRASGEPRVTAPLSPADRRIVHLTLAEAGDVATESLGSGVEKRVRIAPRPTST